MIAAIEAYRAGLYTRAQWLPNLLAGVIVGVVALPLAMAMAFAIASGARPEQGLYTAIIGGPLVTLFGGNHCAAGWHRVAAVGDCGRWHGRHAP
jgi:SulP family sulfate permease